MALYDLFLPYYRNERTLEHPLLTSGQGMHYDAEKGKLVNGEGYSNKEKKKVSKLIKLTGVVESLICISLVSSFMTFGAIDYLEGDKNLSGLLAGLLISTPFIVGFLRNADKTSQWAAVERSYKYE